MQNERKGLEAWSLRETTAVIYTLAVCVLCGVLPLVVRGVSKNTFRTASGFLGERERKRERE
jgi:hypothetical protein